MKSLKMSDVVVLIVIGILFGVLMRVWDELYAVVKPLLPTLRQLLYGMWFMVGPFAFLVVRKPGSALIASVAGASLSAFFGNGLEVLIYGFVQGLGAEIIFASFRYKKYNLVVAGLAGMLSCVGSFLLDLGFGYADLEAWALFVKYGLRLISAFIFTGIFAYFIVKGLEKTKVTTLVRPLHEEDIQQLYK